MPSSADEPRSEEPDTDSGSSVDRDIESADTDRVKASLRRLASNGDEEVIRRADEARTDLEAAAEFVEAIGLPRLETAIEATDEPQTERRGERALAAYQRFRTAAAGDLDISNHFHGGRGTHLRSGAEESTQ